VVHKLCLELPAEVGLARFQFERGGLVLLGLLML
jgi:hypothetical protein